MHPDTKRVDRAPHLEGLYRETVHGALRLEVGERCGRRADLVAHAALVTRPTRP
jgi:hypothetical protein